MELPVLKICIRYCLVSCLCILAGIPAQAQIISSRLFTGRDGLPSTFVFGAYQDKLHYLWVCTAAGISRYDGQSFTNYGLSDGLPEAHVLGAYMDSGLRLWAFTSRGAAEFKNNRFITYPLSDGQLLHWVFDITQTSDGKLYLLTSSGIYQFTGKAWVKTKFYPNYEDHRCLAMLETKDGLYISYGDMLVLKKPDGAYQLIGQPQHDSYYSNLTELDGEVIVSTPGGAAKVSNGQLVSGGSGAQNFQNNYAFLYDHLNRLWTAESAKGVALSMGDNDPHPKMVYTGPPEFLIQNMIEDDQGNIWICTGNGLLRLSEQSFQVYNSNALFGKKLIRHLIDMPDGNMAVNDESLSLQLFFNDSLKKPMKLKTAFTFSRRDFIIDDYLVTPDGSHWYLSRDNVLYRQSGDTLYDQSTLLGKLKGDVTAMCFDKWRKTPVVAIYSQPYPCYLNGNTFQSLPAAKAPVISGQISHFLSCPNGDLLFSTNSGQLYAIDTLNNYRVLLNEFQGQAIINGLLADPSGDVWINYSGRGLRHYNWQNGQLIFRQAIGKAQGLDNDAVSDACFDGKHHLWIATNSGAGQFSRASTTGDYYLLRFFNSARLQIGDEIDTRLQKDRAGNIWLYSIRHLVHFDIGRVPAKDSATVQIEKIDLNLQATDWRQHTDSVTGMFGLPVGLVLKHQDNSLGFSFHGIDVSGTEGIHYSYQLQGFRPEWSTPGENTYVSFVGLPPGKYTFSVKAQVNDGHWSTPATLSFTILKPFWQTWWFYLLALLATASVIYAVFRYRLAQKVKLMDMRNRFSRDLHDEIGSSISGIHLLSQMAMDKLNGQQITAAEDYLLKVKNYTGDVVEKLSDMVWIFNPQNDSLQKLVERLKAFALTMAAAKEINIDFYIDRESESVNLSIQERKAVYLISKEALNNAIKYSGASHIHYRFERMDAHCLLQVRDDGKGFDVENAASGNGLRNMRARAEEVGARFSITSGLSEGTLVRLEL